MRSSGKNISKTVYFFLSSLTRSGHVNETKENEETSKNVKDYWFQGKKILQIEKLCCFKKRVHYPNYKISLKWYSLMHTLIAGCGVPQQM